MNPLFEEFLKSLSQSSFEESYLLLSQDLTDHSDKIIAEKLREICTSHFIRQRSGKLNALFNLKKSGYNPTLVIDVGAQIGTPELYTVYPESHHIFIEPVLECIPTLNNIASSLPSATVLNCAVSNVNGTTSLSVTPTKQYASIDSIIGVENREIDVKTVDSIYEDVNISGPVLLKIDVDGIEVKVLQGSKTVLRNDCIIIIEASLADENPRFNKVVEYLSSFGYEVYDIVDHLYRQSDWHLWQVDLIFVKTNSPIWGSKTYS